MVPILLTAALAFLLGSIPSGLIISRKFYGLDIRTVGSGNIGATNVKRTLGKGPALATLLLDLCKGMGSAGLSWLVASEPLRLECALFFGTCAIFGHCFSPFLKFNGGKGVATALGVFIVVSPLVALASIVIFQTTLKVTKYVSLASLSAAGSVPPLMWVCSQFWPESVAGHTAYSRLSYALALTCVLVVFTRHRANIRRLLTGEEPKAKENSSASQSSECHPEQDEK